MGVVRGEHNIGQLTRERFGDAAALIGFGTHTGTVAAATEWGSDMEVKRVRPSREDSYERLCHDAGHYRFLLDLAGDAALRRRLAEQRLGRFIGVICRPTTELLSRYADASLPQQFDVWVWFDETSAVTPLGPEHYRRDAPETNPFGLCPPVVAWAMRKAAPLIAGVCATQAEPVAREARTQSDTAEPSRPMSDFAAHNRQSRRQFGIDPKGGRQHPDALPYCWTLNACADLSAFGRSKIQNLPGA